MSYEATGDDFRHVAIRVEGISKRYRLGPKEAYRRLSEAITRAVVRPVRRGTSRHSGELIWAVKDVSFTINEGEIVGIVGPNGSGKTTLLKILSKITLPIAGRAEIFGRVGALLEVGTGFHSELTGRENVYLNGAILGMTRREISRKYPVIVAFSELERFMDVPVKHYSSGMRVRLAFSVAAHLDPEILLVDEVLAVGDASFQQKCLGKMEEAAGAGRTVVFVTHNIGQLTRLCTRAMWMQDGSVRMDGDPQDIVEAYLTAGHSSDGRWEHPPDDKCGTLVRIRTAEILGRHDRPRPSVPFEDPIRIRIEYEVSEAIRDVAILVQVSDVTGAPILTTSDIDADPLRRNREPGRLLSTLTIPGALLRPGKYWVTVSAKVRRVKKLDEHVNCLVFEVLPTGLTRRRGAIAPILPWSIEPAEDVRA